MGVNSRFYDGHNAMCALITHGTVCTCGVSELRAEASVEYKKLLRRQLLSEGAVEAFDEAWEETNKIIGRGIAPKGTRTRAGLKAVADLLLPKDW
jgi:hypothetical protein